MVALHPPLSGLPLGFVLLLACVEALRVRPTLRPTLLITRRVLIIAVIFSTVATFLSGYQASGDLGDLAADVQGELGRHHAYGRLLLINSLVMGTFSWIAGRAVHGRTFVTVIYYITLAIQLGLTIAVGWMGGALVFERGLGVRVQ